MNLNYKLKTYKNKIKKIVKNIIKYVEFIMNQLKIKNK
jgi:hypothetical protein